MYIIIGGGGYLGNYLIKNILMRKKERIIATYHSELSKNDSLGGGI